jgi:hypothetical protein
VINESLQFLAEEVNKYLNAKMPGSDLTQPRLVVGNVSLVAENTAADPDVKGKAVLSLINIEEDKVSKLQENYVKTSLTTVYKNPPVSLNLYILFSMNRAKYQDSLIFLSHVIQFFQYQNVFTPITHPNLDSRIQKLIIDLHNLSFEQSNHLWSILGGKYLPSVMYKVRQVTLDENAMISESAFIKEIELKDKTKLPVS